MCPNCRRQLRWYENIPAISFLVLRGKCHTCHNPIPIHFIFVEISTALIFLLAAWLHARAPVFDSLHFVRDLTFLVILIMVFIYDFLYQEILSELVWFGALAALFFNLYLDRSLGYMLIGALATGGFFILQYVISKGRWIGGGDVRLGIMMGVWLGWPVVLVALIIAYVTGAIGSLFLLIFKRKTLSSATPFGTYLTFGTFICLFWGQAILDWYMKFLR